MSSIIYYFSGTGNSLAAAKELNNCLNEKAELVPLSSLLHKKTITVNSDLLGFVFPVYFMNTPEIVKSFIKKLSFQSNPYIFAVITSNGVPGISLFELNKCLSRKGQALSSSYSVDMPGNALKTLPEVKAERLLNYKNEIKKISNSLNNKKVTAKIKFNLISTIESFFCKILGSNFYITSKNACTDSNCTGCGICAKVCPLNNIEMKNKKPHWNNNCSGCLACYHWCPKNAVKGGIMLKNREQYHNPEISIKDMNILNK